MSIDALLFDLDRTLYDRDQAFNKWLQEECKESSINEWQYIFKILHQHDGQGYTSREQFLIHVSDQLNWPRMTIEQRQQRFKDGLLRHSHPQPQVLECLDKLKQRYRLGICSNGRSSMQRDKIAKLNLQKYFDPIIISGEGFLSKPNPAIYRLACEQWGLPECQVMMIGDHVENDINGARIAGLKTCWISAVQNWPTKLKPPNYTCRSINELAELLL